MELIEKVKQGLRHIQELPSLHLLELPTETAKLKELVPDALSVIEQLEAKVPKKGRWIFTGQENAYGGTVIQCPFCHDKYAAHYPSAENYCRTCGAQLREVECNG